MRIVGGRFRGRSLRGPTSSATRPTSDRLREALFNVLAHAYGDPAEGARVLDLFAGTGALALEALSRGARFAVFVEEDSEPRGLIRANVEALGLGGITRIFRRDATRLGVALANDAFDLVFCDPPYGRGLAEKSLLSAREGGWLAPGALVVVEEASEPGFVAPEGFEELERRRYVETELIFLRAPGAA
ncbi:16S rRNA (guanine(966)-N(2))-methyltransferase RsmD [Ancylobacter pratisalsi]|uniref:16S rRNA (Guanine(966)-N(2))-methyltransferase RsmD n=1 Tax=Ancylobacter pratisalsi TaxID=1745854 RepID=A0A6P1YLG4_9HYPH|nr:16S rRNA (guanine(966)-N(2))-methyltransferase RsmD [Ancylobacter pratisalsi]QIB33922.1 16S rRNA (guanine(966)-N(2))-methyltransferase RsmD [Ancylobacter pratisalsi]